MEIITVNRGRNLVSDLGYRGGKVSVGGGTVTFDNAVGATSSGAGSTTQLTISSFVLAAGSNLGLLVLYTAFDATASDARVTGITWNTSEALTKINDTAGITSDAWNGAWFLPNPTPTTANIVLTFAGITTEQNAVALSGSGIDQTTANHKYVFGGTLTDTIVLLQATGIAAGDYAAINIYAEGATSAGTPIAVTPDGATTEICDQSYGSGDHSNWGGRGAVSGSTVSLGGTITGSGLSKDWEGVMVVLRAA